MYKYVHTLSSTYVVQIIQREGITLKMVLNWHIEFYLSAHVCVYMPSSMDEMCLK